MALRSLALVSSSLSVSSTGSFDAVTVGGQSFELAVSSSAATAGFGAGGADLEAVFEEDGNGDLQPRTGTDGLSVFYDYDSNDDIQPRG